ncbi:MBL fold metallo-hydrolase [Actinokineospora xionganensis]|uniref:MBL fold metallo-hydrolase n=1 Tax=Actinokineospora xionganensis TaxID=2684470 RepID=A0ABR7L5Y2_9PSEU|nr:MBL fold metallo-hydrolase [Actinokineospora xionganensis]MBC6448095.1 MBL fold metallo-hydrolase [Actinokineospora xionganensis]
MCLTCVLPLMVSGPAPVFPTSAPEPGWLKDKLGGSITWTGCAGFVLEVGGERICFDPYASNPGLRDTLFRPARPDHALVERTFGKVSGIFVGHTHFDHAMDVAPLAKANPGCVVHASPTTTEICRRQGVPDDQLHPVEDGERVTIGPFTVEAIASRHGTVPIASRIDVIELRGEGMPKTVFRWPRGQVFAYRVEVGGLSLHLQTSAGIEDSPLARQAPVDVLIACLAARQGTEGYFRRLGERLCPKVIIPCHHDNFFRPLSEPPRPVARLDWPGFLDDVARLADAYGTRLVQLPRGAAVAI